MNEQLEEINERYVEKSVGMFPFISKARVTVLKKGFHQKKDANYRGVSMVYDKTQEKRKAMLIGYYFVPKDYIIVPQGLSITEGKRKLIRDKINKGFELTTSFPSLLPVEFAEDTEEFAVAKQVNDNYKAEKA